MVASAVEQYLDELDHPFTAEVLRLREIVLEASPAIQERIKWKSPSFYSGSDDLGAFELRPREFVRLILVFPHGLVPDPDGIMQGTWADRRELRFADLADIDAKRESLQAIVRGWVELLPR